LRSTSSCSLGTCFQPEYNPEGPPPSNVLDVLFFGNDDDNGFLGTSVLEVITIAIFTVDYVLRFATAHEADESYAGFCGRLRFLVSFYSIVDLLSTVPFYVDLALVDANLPPSQVRTAQPRCLGAVLSAARDT
jgi:hypothetical protein